MPLDRAVVDQFREGLVPVLTGVSTHALLGTGVFGTVITVTTATAWGTITGTVSTQTDLQSALNAKASTTHAAQHMHGGADEVATATVSSNAIPKSGATSTLAIGWFPLGTTSTTVCVGNDSRLSDSRTPLAHTSTHRAGGTDIIPLDTLGAPTDNTTLDATTSTHGLMMKYPNNTSTFLRADGSFAVPTASATWGAISGTLSNQTDLQTALDAKASKAFAIAMAVAL